MIFTIAGDSIIRDCVFCQKKILLHAAISQNPTRPVHSHKFLLHILCHKTRYFSLGPEVNILQLLGDFVP